MKKIALYILSIALLGSVCSCLDDKNDYNYKPVNELKNPSNFTNINSSYNVGADEDLKLEPKFRFSIDSINPDVSYEWILNDKLLEAKTPTYTFNSSKGGLFELTFSVIDNKSGVKFSYSTNILVRSPYQRGWVILTEVDGKSTLSLVKLKTLYGVSEAVNQWGETVTRDSVAYHDVEKNLIQNLGTNPIGIMEHLGYPSAFGKSEAVYDELVIMQDRWVELNGNTLEREVYTDQEFNGDLPAGGFKPVEAAMSYSAKFIRDEKGHIYVNQKAVANDFHAGSYISVPLWNGTEFSALYPIQKFRDRNMDAVLACRRKDNTLVIIRNGGGVKNSSNDPTFYPNSTSDTGELKEFEGDNADKFQNMDKDIVTMKTASVYLNGDAFQAWAGLMKAKDSKAYQLRYFRMKNKNYKLYDYYENDLTALNGKNYSDMAVFESKQYVVLAMDNELWYCQYVKDVVSTPKLLHTFDQNIVSISSNDIALYSKYGSYNGQLGVALEDGSFFIYGVVENDKQESGLVEQPELQQLYPNEESDKAGDNKFGKIIDVLYKIGNANQLVQFDL